MRKLLFFVLLLPFSISCQNGGKINIEAYYYPYKTLKDGSIYQYNDVEGRQPPTFWYYRTIVTDTAAYLTATNYDIDGNQTQIATEEIVGNGMLLHQLRIMEYDSTATTSYFADADIIHDNVFPFEVSDSTGMFLYKIQWTSPLNPNEKITILRNRFFKGFEKYKYKEYTYPCAKFEVHERISIDSDDGSYESEPISTELYAKGIGLVYYKKKINENITWEFELADIYPMTEFEKQFK